MSVWVAGRQVYVNTQRSQTVKICTARNIRGEYEKYYRIEPPYVLPQQQMELTVSRFTNLPDLEQWLVNDRKGHREPQSEASYSLGTQPSPSALSPQDDEFDDPNHAEAREVTGAVAEVLDLLSSARYSPDDDPWLPQAKSLVEQSIDSLLEEFLEFPYLHRVEHSIHAQLFHIMMSHGELARRVPLGNDLALTQLTHKEWPESVARGENRRGNFDLALLSPLLLKGCPSISAFRQGHLHAPFVIELGLDYDAEHLANDAKKLINSKPKYGYLVHLVRELPRELAAEQIVLGMEGKFGIKTAYVWAGGSQRAFKQVNDQAITER
jgi:hypothetical protein